MTAPDRSTKDYIQSNPFAAFGLLCLNNEDLQVVKKEDANLYVRKYNWSIRTNMATTLVSAGLVGGLSARFLPGKGILRGIGVVYLTVLGAAIGQRVGDISTRGTYNQLSTIMRRYDHWNEDPKVLGYFESRPKLN